MAGSNIDDAETAVAQSDSLVDENALIVRTTMSDHVAHAFEHACVDAASRPAGKRNPVNSAHIYFLFCVFPQAGVFNARTRLYNSFPGNLELLPAKQNQFPGSRIVSVKP